jgi:MFS family permease
VNDIQRLSIGRFLQNLSFAAPIQTLFFQARGLSLGQIMILQSILLGSALLLEIPTGMLGDRIGKKRSIVLGVGCALLAWIPWFLATDVWTFSVAFVLLGASQAFISGSDQALLYELLTSKGRQKDMQKTYGMYLAMSTFGFALAGLIGGFLAMEQTLAEFIRLYAFSAAAQIFAFILFLSVREPTLPVSDVQIAPAERRILFTAFHVLKSNGGLRGIVMLSVLTAPFSVALLMLFQPYFVLSSVPTPWFGIALFLSSLAASGSKIFAHRLEETLGMEWAAFLSTVLPGILWVLMALVFHPAIAVLLFILSDAAGNLRDPIFADYMNRHIPSSARATTLSAISLITSLYLLLMQPIVGVLADIDLRYAFFCMGGIIIVGAIVFRIRKSHIVPQM